MTLGILGKKIGMTQLFDGDGVQIPVTVIHVAPNVVLQKRTVEKDGYTALQLGAFPLKRINRAQVGHAKKSGQVPMSFVKEIRTDDVDGVDLGDQVSIENISIGDFVDVTARSIGKGFQGVVKRHGFAGGPGGHGSMFHRAPGSIGSRAGGKACRKKVRKGKKLPGHDGDVVVKVQNVKVVDVDLAASLLVLQGGVPGGGGNFVLIETALKKGKGRAQWKVIKAQAKDVSAVEKSEANKNG